MRKTTIDGDLEVGNDGIERHGEFCDAERRTDGGADP